MDSEYRVVAPGGVLWLGVGGGRWPKGAVLPVGLFTPETIAEMLKGGIVEEVRPQRRQVLERLEDEDENEDEIVEELMLVPGIDRAGALVLKALGVVTIDGIVQAPDEVLVRLWGVGPKRAAELRRNARKVLG